MSDNKITLDKYGFTEEITHFCKSIMCAYTERNVYINLEKKISINLFNYLFENNYLNHISPNSLSLYAPISTFNKFSNKIQWEYVIKRDDLSKDFIKEHITKFNLQHLNHKFYWDFDLMLENIKNNTFSSIFYMVTELLLSKKYNYNQFIILLKNIIERSTDTSYSYKKYTKNEFENCIKLYIDNYYKSGSSQNIIKLKEFLNILYPATGMNNKLNYDLTYIIVELLHDKLTSWDLEYLINNDLVSYYTGKIKLNKELITVFYNNRVKLFNTNLVGKNNICNPFMNDNYKYYSYEEIDNLINVIVNAGMAKYDLWNYISYYVLNFETPKWFWKKHSSNIHWYIATEHMIELYNENDFINNQIFLQWILDNDTNIYNGFILNYQKGFILPEIFIAYFADYQNIQYTFLNTILQIQKLSITLLYYLADNNLLNANQWESISNFQLMNPEFIKKYDTKLNWGLLMFNVTFAEYSFDKFHRLPQMDTNNRFLWMSIDDKVKELNRMGIICEANKTDMTIILKSKSIECKVLNHYITRNNYLIASSVSKKSNQIKDLIFNSSKQNWTIRNTNNFGIVEENDYHKVVFNFNQHLINGLGIPLQAISNFNSMKYQLMSVALIGNNNNYYGNNIINKICIPYKYLLFSNTTHSSPNNSFIALYYPLQYSI